VAKANKTYLASGRINQKTRTKESLLEAAADMIREGKPISIAEVADRARIGRTTAYRYFPTSELLIANAALWKVTGRTERESVHLIKPSMSPFEKLDVVVVQSDRSTREHRNEYRAMLRASLDQISGEPNRSGIRLDLLKDALGSLEDQLAPDTLQNLFSALSLTLGIEAQVVLEDVCRMSPSKAREVKRWAARALLQAALTNVEADVDGLHMQSLKNG
jgi:AcrR family transcriptional regulator